MQGNILIRKVAVFIFALGFFYTSLIHAGEASGPEPVAGEKAWIHNFEVSPLGLLGGYYPLSYALIHDRISVGAIGGVIYSNYSSASLSGYMGGVFAAYNFEEFHADPAYIGAGITYSASEGTIKIGTKDPYKAGLEAAVTSFSLFYGHSYVWKNGFTMSWRLGVALPLTWDYQWENVTGATSDKFDEDTEFYETISKVVGAVFGGSGFGIGWSF